MKRLTVTLAALAALIVGLTACGSDDHSSTDADGLRRNASAVVTPSPAPSGPAIPAPESSTPAEVPSTSEAAPDSSAGSASKTTCGEFRELDIAGEKALMERILAENPGSKFDGSPNVALGTAKLVCLSESKSDTPVAVAIGVVTG